MKEVSFAVGLMLLLSATAAIGGSSPKTGTPVAEGGLFLYREPIEIYWNDWRGVLVTRPFTNQAEVAIIGEGKTVDFASILSINCVNGKNFWRTEALDFEDKIQKPVIPKPVIQNAVKLFCRR